MRSIDHYRMPAFAEGEAAARAYNSAYGIGFDDYPNPYPEGSEERKAWNMGWNNALRR